MKKRSLVVVLTLSSTLLAAVAQNTQPTSWGYGKVLKPNEAVIMAQWAVGDGLKRWMKKCQNC